MPLRRRHDRLAALPRDPRADDYPMPTVPYGWYAVLRGEELRPGEAVSLHYFGRVLVQGGAGGVGSVAVQIARALGARVTTTALPQDREFVTRLGADRVVDYSTERFEDRVADVDVVFDAVGGETQSRSWAVLCPGGTLVGIVQPPDPAAATDASARGVFFVVEPDRAGLEAVTELIDDGRLTPAVERVVLLTETRAAYEALAKEHPRGKIVLRVGEGG